MLVSGYIKEILPEQFISAKNEQEVSGLGLNNYGPNFPYCCFVMKEIYLQDLSECLVEVITIPELEEAVLEKGLGCIVVKDPKNVFFMLHNYLVTNRIYGTDMLDTIIGKECNISEKAVISPFDVKIGNKVVIEENVVIRDGVEIGDNAIIRAGSVLGGQDLEVKRSGMELYRVKHLGKVSIGANVEIGYNNVIGRAVYPWDVTRISDYVQTSQNVVIGHGVKIDKRVEISSGTTICGRTKIGEDVWVGPNVVVGNGLVVGANSYVSIGSCVIKSIDENVKVFGNPARTMPM